MKLQEFQELLKKEKIDFCILYNALENKKDYNLLYFLQEPLDYGCLVISPSEVKLYVPGFEYYRIKDKLKGIKVVLSKKGLFADVRKDFKGNTIGINKELVSLQEFDKISAVFTKCSFTDVSEMCKELRMTKTTEEMDIMRKACQITDEIIEGLFKKLKGFKTEKDIDTSLRTEVAARGLTLSFDPIVASGGNAYYPHHEAGDSLLKGFCVIDFGIKYKNYCTDMTRTVYFGSPSKKDLAYYDLVLQCQTSLIKGLTPGMTLGELQEKCIALLGGNGKDMIHGVGHSVGLEVHDPLPHKKHQKELPLQKGMIYTIEPGVYLKGKLGIRIEDDIFMGEDVEVLNKTPKELVIVEKQ